eukprot:3131079-Amphidinium_carterae.1
MKKAGCTCSEINDAYHFNNCDIAAVRRLHPQQEVQSDEDEEQSAAEGNDTITAYKGKCKPKRSGFGENIHSRRPSTASTT